MAITKRDLLVYQEEKTTELELLRADKESAKNEIEEKVKAYRKTFDEDLKAEFDPKEASIKGSIETINILIEKAGNDDIIVKEEL